MNQPNQQNLSERHWVFVAYRPNGQDTCRGCLMGSSDSDFQMFSTKDFRKVISSWVNLLKDEWKTRQDREYCKWDLNLVDLEGEMHTLTTEYPQWLAQPLKGWWEEAHGLFNKWKIDEESKVNLKLADAERARRYALEQEERKRLAELLVKYPGAV